MCRSYSTQGGVVFSVSSLGRLSHVQFVQNIAIVAEVSHCSSASVTQ